MLATLFYMQACGSFLANIVTLIAVEGFKSYLPTDTHDCDASCRETVDIMWRWIVGLGAVPPAIAALLRWWIPESPRYLIEIEKSMSKAQQDVQMYFPSANNGGEEAMMNASDGMDMGMVPSAPSDHGRPGVVPRRHSSIANINNINSSSSGRSSRSSGIESSSDSTVGRGHTTTLPAPPLKFGEPIETSEIELSPQSGIMPATPGSLCDGRLDRSSCPLLQ